MNSELLMFLVMERERSAEAARQRCVEARWGRVELTNRQNQHQEQPRDKAPEDLLPDPPRLDPREAKQKVLWRRAALAPRPRRRRRGRRIPHRLWIPPSPPPPPPLLPRRLLPLRCRRRSPPPMRPPATPTPTPLPPLPPSPPLPPHHRRLGLRHAAAAAPPRPRPRRRPIRPLRPRPRQIRQVQPRAREVLHADAELGRLRRGEDAVAGDTGVDDGVGREPVARVVAAAGARGTGVAAAGDAEEREAEAGEEAGGDGGAGALRHFGGVLGFEVGGGGVGRGGVG